MFKLIFISSTGESIELFDSPFRLMRVEGLGDVEADVQTQKSPFQDGSTLIDTTLEEKPITIELKIVGKNEIELAKNRRKLASIFNPKLGEGLLERHSVDGVHQIGAVAGAVPFFPDGRGNRGKNYQKALINLRAPNPYWKSPSATNIKLEDFVSNFRFPFSFPVHFAVRGDMRVINNTGDAPTPLRITFKGNSINPVIRNTTTGEFVKINYEIPSDHVFVIDTEHKTVTMYDSTGVGTKMFRYMDLESTFFDLIEGENELTFKTDGGSPEVYIEYRERYVAV